MSMVFPLTRLQQYNLLYPPFYVYYVETQFGFGSKILYYSYENIELEGECFSRVLEIPTGNPIRLNLSAHRVSPSSRYWVPKKELYSLLSRTSDDSVREILKDRIRSCLE